MHIVYGVGGYATLANIFFLLSGFASDLILLRLWLCFSYAFLLIFGALGYPRWGEWGQQTPNLLELGGILWPAIVLLLHLYHLLVLIWDERPIFFASEDEEQLWRLFYRRSGMGRLEMRIALKLGSWQQFKAGETVFEVGANGVQCMNLHLLAEGVCSFEANSDGNLGKREVCKRLYSGALFDLKLGNAFGVYLGLEQSRIRRVAAETDCLMYVWSFDAVQQMTGAASPALATFWRNYILYSLGSAYSDSTNELYSSSGETEDKAVLLGARTRDMTQPLQPQERSSFSMAGFIWWLLMMHYPIPPSGQRHHGMPPSGMMARGRMLAQSGCGTSPSSNSPPSKFGNGRHRRSMSSETAESSDGDFKSAV